MLADEPGLGKSRQLIESAVEPVLIVAPAMVLESGVWDDELARWAPGLDATQVAYSSITRRERTAKGGSRPTGVLRPELDRPWGSIIADEAHYLKGRKTTWTQAFLQLRGGGVHQATGTPIPNWAHEAFVPLQLCYPEDAQRGERFGSYWRWAKEWFDCHPTRWSPMEVGNLRADRTWEEFRRENWGDRFLMRLREDCLDLPPLTTQRWVVRMGREQKRVYNQLRRDFLAFLEDGTEVVAWNSAAQTIKLCKAATGLEVLQEGAGGSAKLDALKTILEDRPRPTLVVAHFRDTVAACVRVAESVGATARVVTGEAKKGRKEAIRAFQSGSLDVLVATIDTISEGMTLHQGGADQIVRIERSYRPSRNEQVVRRLHRIGVERPVLVIDLITEGTIDQRILRILATKTDQQMRALGLRELREAA